MVQMLAVFLNFILFLIFLTPARGFIQWSMVKIYFNLEELVLLLNFGFSASLATFHHHLVQLQHEYVPFTLNHFQFFLRKILLLVFFSFDLVLLSVFPSHNLLWNDYTFSLGDEI